jgi:hypothetical protein
MNVSEFHALSAYQASAVRRHPVGAGLRREEGQRSRNIRTTKLMSGAGPSPSDSSHHRLTDDELAARRAILVDASIQGGTLDSGEIHSASEERAARVRDGRIGPVAWAKGCVPGWEQRNAVGDSLQLSKKIRHSENLCLLGTGSSRPVGARGFRDCTLRIAGLLASVESWEADFLGIPKGVFRQCESNGQQVREAGGKPPIDNRHPESGIVAERLRNPRIFAPSRSLSARGSVLVRQLEDPKPDEVFLDSPEHHRLISMKVQHSAKTVRLQCQGCSRQNRLETALG